MESAIASNMSADNALQIAQVAHRSGLIERGLRAILKVFIALIGRNILLILGAFWIYLAVSLSYHTLMTFGAWYGPLTSPVCTDRSTNCEDCLSDNFYKEQPYCLWNQGTGTCSFAAIFPGSNVTGWASNPDDCEYYQCSMRQYGWTPFICLHSANFMFWFTCIMLPAFFLLNLIQMYRTQRMSAIRSYRTMQESRQRATLSYQSPDYFPVDLQQRCGACNYPTTIYPVCGLCLLTKMHTLLHWMTLWILPLFYFGWSTWDYYGNATTDWVGFVVLIPLAVFLVLAVASFIGLSVVSSHEPYGNEVSVVDPMASTEHLTLLNDTSREQIGKLNTSAFVDAILENLEYAKPPPPEPEPAPVPVQPQTPPAAAATANQDGIGGFFRNLVTTVQTATTSVLSSPVMKPKAKDQEQVIWAEEYTGMLTGRNNTRRMKATVFWLMAIVLLVNTGLLLWTLWSNNVVATNALAFICVAEICTIVGLIGLGLDWTNKQALVLTSKQIMVISTEAPIPFVWLGKTYVRVSRLPLARMVVCAIDGYVPGTYFSPLAWCSSGQSDPIIKEGVVNVYTPCTPYEGGSPNPEAVFSIDLQDCSPFKSSLMSLGFQQSDQDPTGAARHCFSLRVIPPGWWGILNYVFIGGIVALLIVAFIWGSAAVGTNSTPARLGVWILVLVTLFAGFVITAIWRKQAIARSYYYFK